LTTFSTLFFFCLSPKFFLVIQMVYLAIAVASHVTLAFSAETSTRFTVLCHIRVLINVFGAFFTALLIWFLRAFSVRVGFTNGGDQFFLSPLILPFSICSLRIISRVSLT
jgi:hypothetical protein